MEINNKTINNLNYKYLLILCDSKILTINLINQLKNIDLKIFVISKQNKFLSKLYLNDEKVFFVKDVREFFEKYSKLDYLIYVKSTQRNYIFGKEIFLEALKKDILIFKRFVKKYNPKSIFLTGGIGNKNISKKKLFEYEKHFKIIKSFGALVLYSDLISEEKEDIALSDLYLNLVKIAEKDKKIKVNKDVVYYPVTVEELCINLIQILFSLKSYGKTTLIVGRSLTTDTLSKIVGDRLKVIRRGKQQRFLLPSDEIISSRKKSKLIVGKVYESLKKKLNTSVSVPKKKVLNPDFLGVLSSRKILEKIEHFFLYQKLKLLLGFVITLLFIPLLLIMLSLSLLYFSKLTYDKNLIYFSINSSRLSLNVLNKNKSYIYVVKEVPYIGNYFRIYLKPTSILILQAESAIEGLGIIKSFSNYFKSIYIKEGVDTEFLTQELISSLDIFYQKLGFLESEISEEENTHHIKATLLVKGEDLRNARQKAFLVRKVVERMPFLLGEDKQRKYGLIFQNNSILRPTGGSIEAFSIIDFSGSKIVSDTLFNVSSLDKSLKSKLEPSFVLSKYFKVDRLYFRDSNWDPDFPSSASQMEFLFDKEIGGSLDGLILIDRKFVYEYLNILLESKNSKEYLNRYFNKNSYNNNYPNDSEESLLTNLLGDSISYKANLNSVKATKIVKEIYKGLENRNIQVFIKDPETSNDLTDLKWDGSFEKIGCTKPCYSEFVSLIESTYEGDSNLVIREAQLSLNFQEGVVKRKMNIYFENMNDITYKAYLRLYANADVGFSPVKIDSENNERYSDPEIRSSKGLKEAGIYIEVKPKQTALFTFGWEGLGDYDFEQKGEYILLWRKQAGVDPYLVEIIVSLPAEVTVNSSPEYSLTGGGVFRYNTSLDVDFITDIYW